MVSSIVRRGQITATVVENDEEDEQNNSAKHSDGGDTTRREVAKVTDQDSLPNSVNTVRICPQLFVFRGEPNVWNKRHVLIYFTSPDLPNFFHTVRAQRQDEKSEWFVSHLRGPQDWPLDAAYLSHVNCGAIVVPRGKETTLVNITAGISGAGRDADWSCQNFVLEGLEEIANQGFQTKEWYEYILEELMDKLLDESVDAL